MLRWLAANWTDDGQRWPRRDLWQQPAAARRWRRRCASQLALLGRAGVGNWCSVPLPLYEILSTYIRRSVRGVCAKTAKLVCRRKYPRDPVGRLAVRPWRRVGCCSGGGYSAAARARAPGPVGRPPPQSWQLVSERTNHQARPLVV